MGKLNLLKGAYEGKVGQTVGSKWKNLSTIRTYAKPANPNTPAQQTTRTGFSLISAFVALFSDLIRRLSALDTRAMSVRNAILQLNASQVAAGALTTSTLIVSKGGLPVPATFAATVAAGLANLTATWAEVVSSAVSAAALVVVVVVDKTDKRAYVGSALNSLETITIPGPFTASAQLDVYYYLLDTRGSSKVASNNGYKSVTAPAA